MCCKDKNCFLVTLISSIVIGIGIAGAFFAGLLSNVSILIYITLALGILMVLISLFKNICEKFMEKDEKCFVLIGIGAIIISIVALLAPTLATGARSVAALVGAVAFFLVWSLLELVKLAFPRERCNKFD